jgi:hypothetical protein
MKKLILLSFLIFNLQNSFAQTSWSDGVGCIVYSHCSSCHNPKGIAPFTLMSYSDAFAKKSLISSAVSSKSMPPHPANTTKTKYAHSNILSQTEIDKIVAWVANGAPEGNAAKAPIPPSFSSAYEMNSPDLVLKIPNYTVNTTTDLYRCFVLTTNLSQSKNIESIEVIPGNRSLVHHVLVFQDSTLVPVNLDNADPDPGYNSFGGIGSNAASLISGYVPGQSMLTYPNGFGPLLNKSSRIVLQIHYPGGISSKVDSTQIRIKFRTSPVRNLNMDPILNHESNIDRPLSIPANTTQTFSETFTVPVNITVTGVLPHMHLIGKSIKSFAITPAKDTIFLVDISNWDFHWQYFYTFQKPVKVPAGSTLYAFANYDNTTSNPNNPSSPPILVKKGEATTDEMMLVYFNYTLYQSGDENIIVDTASNFPHLKSCEQTASIHHSQLNAEDISIAPNPSLGSFNIEGINQPVDIDVFNSIGELVLEKQKIQPKELINISDFAKGMYYIQIKSRNNIVYKKVLRN